MAIYFPFSFVFLFSSDASYAEAKIHILTFLVTQDGKEAAHNAGDTGLIPGSGRSPGEGNGNPLQYSCLGNPMDREAWRATVHRVAKSRPQLTN